MAGANKCCDGLLVNTRFFEADAFIFLLDWCCRPNLAIPFTDVDGDVCDLPTPFFTALDLTAKVLERLHEEALYVMWLQALGLCSLHLKAEFLYPCWRHRIISERSPLKQLEKVVLINSTIDCLE